MDQSKSTIFIQAEGLGAEETLKLKEIFEHLILHGISRVKGGRMTLNFDFDGTLQEVEVSIKRKVRPLTRTSESYSVEVKRPSLTP